MIKTFNSMSCAMRLQIQDHGATFIGKEKPFAHVRNIYGFVTSCKRANIANYINASLF